ncbi:MAG TPA: protein kinase, partial [Pyrinomonadaceae bacterium]|nr:protein kinase [Pyrinomonadaceae bacterium]
DPDPLVGHVIDSRYRLDAKIGSGGMGAVYRATRISIGDAVAVKILHRDHVADPQAAERFRREAHTAARLKHPNAVGVYDFGVSPDGLMYLVMELVEGQSLREAIERHGPLPLAVVSDVAAQVCSALDEAHRLGIIHRDIKPDNIVLQESRAGLRVKVLDFGIAKLHDVAQSKLTQTGGIIGTPHYMSPEQCMGEELDQRSDIYSLGIVLYEMLRGTVPFDSPTTSAVVVQQVTQAPPPLYTAAGNVTPAVEGVVMRALAKRRESRQQTAVELARELSDAVHGTAGIGLTTMPINPAGAATSPITRQTPWVPTTAVSPQSFSGGLHPSPVVSAAAPGEPITGANTKRSYWPLAIAAVLLLVFATGVLGGVAWLRLSRAEDKAEKVEPSAMGQVAKRLGGGGGQPPAAQTGDMAGRNMSAGAPTPLPTAAPVAAAPADEEINTLRARRLHATASELSGIASALAEAERRYPADFRFTYERAKLFVTGHDHHQAFDLLFTAARKAIAGGKAGEMLDALTLDAGGDFRRLAGGHDEWRSLTESLRSNDPGALKGHVEH